VYVPVLVLVHVPVYVPVLELVHVPVYVPVLVLVHVPVYVPVCVPVYIPVHVPGRATWILISRFLKFRVISRVFLIFSTSSMLSLFLVQNNHPEDGFPASNI
jgi:hypothetical protein